jgi:hypothetical protein
MRTGNLRSSAATESSGVELDGRARQTMSRYVTAFSAVVPAAPATAPHASA